MKISAELKIMITAACSAAYIASAADSVESNNSVFHQSNRAVADLGLASKKDALANQCISDLIRAKRFDNESLKKAEPGLRAAFQNVCAIAYSGAKGYEAALFLAFPLSDAAKKVGDTKLAKAAEQIIELGRDSLHRAAQ